MKIGLVVASVAAMAVTAIGCAAPVQQAAPQIPEPEVASASLASARADVSAPTPEVVSETKSEPDVTVPDACSGQQAIKDTKACLPAAAFAKKLCSGINPEAALTMFAKGTPWTRIWLAGDVEAWNASGGLTHRTNLAFDEEVIVLSRHAASGGIVMTGAMASYDVLRWDGTCVSVMEGELTTRRPPAPKPAPIPWRRLEEGTRRELLASPRVKASYDAIDKSCSAAVDKKPCDKAEKAFAVAIADFVRTQSRPRH